MQMLISFNVTLIVRAMNVRLNHKLILLCMDVLSHYAIGLVTSRSFHDHDRFELFIRKGYGLLIEQEYDNVLIDNATGKTTPIYSFEEVHEVCVLLSQTVLFDLISVINTIESQYSLRQMKASHIRHNTLFTVATCRPLLPPSLNEGQPNARFNYGID